MEVNDSWGTGVVVSTNLSDDDEGRAREEIESFVLDYLNHKYEVTGFDFNHGEDEVFVGIERTR